MPARIIYQIQSDGQLGRWRQVFEDIAPSGWTFREPPSPKANETIIWRKREWVAVPNGEANSRKDKKEKADKKNDITRQTITELTDAIPLIELYRVFFRNDARIKPILARYDAAMRG